MDRQDIYQLLRQESEKKGYLFKSSENIGSKFGFTVSSGTNTIFGSVYSNKMEEDIYQGISKITYDLYSSNIQNSFLILVDKKDNHFLTIPFEIMKNEFFPRQGKNQVHYDFNLLRNPYRLQKSKMDITAYQDNLDIIFGKLALENVSIRNNHTPMYITGYNDANLHISKTNEILGWQDNPHTLTQGDLVFVFNTTTDKIESCFEILSPSESQYPLWKEEMNSEPPKMVFGYRWNAKLRASQLSIDKGEIFELEPFKNNKKNFSLLIRNRHPRSLMDEQYKQFRKYLLERMNDNNNLDSAKYFLLRSQLNSGWQDIEGKEYHYGDNVPNHTKLTPGSEIILFRSEKSTITILGFSNIIFIVDSNMGKTTNSGKAVKEKITFLDNYLPQNPPVVLDDNLVSKIKSLPTYNNQHSIIPITKEIYDLIRTQKQPYTIEKLVDTVLKDKEMIQEWETILDDRRQIIFYGPPGTGKTFIAIELSKYLVSKYGGELIIVQFHPSYSYEDFMEGLKPEVNSVGNISYEVKDGLFKEFCKEAINDPYSKYIMIIDEVNRGNLSKIFGELLFSLEYRRYENNVILPYSKEKFHIPHNLFIIGTMNSADRSIALVDYALRRRFYFIELLPDEQILKKYLEKNIPKDISSEEIISLFNEINKIIENDTLGKHYKLGHSYFMSLNIDRVKIERLWRYAIKPILEEYFLDDVSHLRNLENKVKNLASIKKELKTETKENEN